MNGITAKSILITAIACGALLGFIFWRVESHAGTGSITHTVIVADISESVTKDSAAVAGLAEQALDLSKRGKGATIAVLLTGDDRSAGEPRLVAKYNAPFSRRAIEGKGSLLKKQQEILRDLRAKIEKAPFTARSPIFLAVKRAVEQLRAGGCRADSDCYVFVRTDGEELSEPAVRESLTAGHNRNDLPDPIANEGIQVAFCGLAETNTSRNADSARSHTHTAKHDDRLREVWLALFSAPESVSFEPYCPKPSEFERAAR